MKRSVREVIVVEGRYDKNALSQVVDATIVTLEGFSVFRDREKLDYLRTLAEKRGVIVLTDSDGAGLLLRNYLKSVLPKEYLRQAYIPDVYGKEKRKRAPSKEGKLGVEGMKPQALLDALTRCGATFEDGETPPRGDAVTKADLCAWGLSGGADSAQKRRALLKKLALPERLGANAMLEAINLLMTREEAEALLAEEDKSDQVIQEE
ncbi:MAG: DUF4093 domain-containing protein [Oscillibacter sp.]|nr:DUF4093 domain-containing protein [Oscillibacter sp.]